MLIEEFLEINGMIKKNVITTSIKYKQYQAKEGGLPP
jgi:hypothetical protein